MSWLRGVLKDILPADELRQVPKGFERLGHVAVINLPENLRHRAETVARKLLGVGGVETVVVRLGPIESWSREPRVEVVVGEPVTETLHREGGCWFKLDVARVMFSKGNLYERQRIPKLVEDGETVVDLFAGIGQFTIPIAKRASPRRVYAVEKNPVAYHYLCENVRINKVGNVVVPILGDCERVAPRSAADRVVMGILHVGYRYLPLAFEVLRPEGGVIHYHEAAPYGQRFERPMKRILEVAGGREVEFLGKRRVKRYSPGVDHVVVDARVGPLKRI